MKPGPKSAVLVIDVQNGLFGSSPPPFEADAVLEQINRVLARARRAGLPIFFLQHDGDASENVAPLTNGWRLHDRLLVDPADKIIRKTTCDSFYKTSLEADLRSREISRLFIMGYATDFCIDATVRSAASKEFEVVVISDAHTTNDNPVLKAQQVRDHLNWVWPNCAAAIGITVIPAAEFAED